MFSDDMQFISTGYSKIPDMSLSDTSWTWTWTWTCLEHICMLYRKFSFFIENFQEWSCRVSLSCQCRRFTTYVCNYVAEILVHLVSISILFKLITICCWITTMGNAQISYWLTIILLEFAGGKLEQPHWCGIVLKVGSS